MRPHARMLVRICVDIAEWKKMWIINAIVWELIVETFWVLLIFIIECIQYVVDTCVHTHNIFTSWNI